MLFKGCLHIILVVIFFFIFKILLEEFESRKLLKKIIVQKNKVKNINIFKKVENTILELFKVYNNKTKFVTPAIIIIISIILSIAIYYISYNIFDIASTAMIISIFSLYIPILVLRIIIKMKKEKLLNAFPNYIINLKNYIQVSNDIIIAFKKTYAEGELAIYINKFNLSIEKGVNIFECFENLKDDINIKKISEFITALQFCYINGGDFEKLLDKYLGILTNSNINKEQEREKSFSSKIVLVILICINIYMLFAFIYSNIEYKHIITTTFIGKIIVNINILSYIVIVYFINKLNKMEE